MSEELGQGNDGVSSSDPAGSPGQGEQQSSEPNQDAVTEWKSKYEKAETDLQKVRDFYQQNPKAMQFLQKYVGDDRAQKMVDDYLSGNIPSSANGNEGNSSSNALDGLDSDTRNLVEQIVNDRIKSFQEETEQRYSRLEKESQQEKIDRWRSQYTKDKGWPINFGEVEQDIVRYLQEGRAVDAESAFKLIVADRLPSIQKEQHQQMTKLKTQAAMSRSSVPRTLAKPGKDYAPKSLEEAFAEAIEKVGVGS